MNKSLLWGSAFCVLLTGASCGGHDPKGKKVADPEGVHEEAEHRGTPQTEEGEHDHGDEIVFSSCQAREAGVKVAEIHPGDFNEILKVSGLIEVSQGDEVTVSATSEGLVSFASPLTEGESVRKGTTLLALSTQTLSGGDPLSKAKIAYDLAGQELERVEKLYNQHLNTSKDLLAARQSYEEAQLSYRSLAAGHLGNGRGIAAPLTGYVKSIQVREGDYVTQGQPLLTVTRNRRLTLKARVPERYFDRLSAISSANFRTSYEKKVYRLDQLRGNVLSVGKSADPDSYASIFFEFDNVGNCIPGSYVEVYLLGAPRQGVLSLPREAITEEEGLYFVYLQVDEEGYVKREVQVGADAGDRVEILSGIHSGDRVVVSGAYQLRLASATSTIPAHSHSH